jgi:3-hydroxybutyryl-CoA dehydratase
MLRDEAAELPFAQLRTGMRTAFEFAISAEQMRAFEALSGDRSPVHVDAGFACAGGFEGPVVYGGLLVAQLSRLIGMELPGRHALWTGLRIQFVRPLYVGQRARLEAEIRHVSEAVRAVDLRFEVRAGDVAIASGTAEVSLRA